MAKYINADKLIEGLDEQRKDILKRVATAKTDAEKEKLRMNYENVVGLMFMIDYLKGESVVPVEDLYFEPYHALMRIQKDCEAKLEEKKNPDVVNVVRCRNCKYGHQRVVYDENKVRHTSDEYWCYVKGNYLMYGNDFCSYGERKENEG